MVNSYNSDTIWEHKNNQKTGSKYETALKNDNWGYFLATTPVPTCVHMDTWTHTHGEGATNHHKTTESYYTDGISFLVIQ